MRIGLLVSVLFLFNCSIIAQNDFPNLWKTGKEKEIYGHLILRTEGAGASSPYIIYKNKQQLIDDANNKAKALMWTKDSLLKVTQMYDSLYKGGLISVQLVSNTIQGADPKNLTIIIHDLSGNELYRKRLDSSVPDYSIIANSTFWYGYSSLFVPIELTAPFKVYIINSQYTDEKYSKVSYLINN